MYDSDGLRASKTAASGTRYFLYDGTQPVCELSGSGGTTSVVATNTFGINGLVSRNDSSGTNFYAFDPQGSTAERVDSSGALVSTDAYNAWGTRTSTGSGDVFGYGAQWGYYTDAETGFVLCTHRYYDPARGRWLTRDPVGYAGGRNVYQYVSNGPLTFVDFYGLTEYTPGPGQTFDECMELNDMALQRALDVCRAYEDDYPMKYARCIADARYDWTMQRLDCMEHAIDKKVEQARECANDILHNTYNGNPIFGDPSPNPTYPIIPPWRWFPIPE